MDRLHSFAYIPSHCQMCTRGYTSERLAFSLEAGEGEQLASEGFALELLMLSPGNHGWPAISLGESHPLKTVPSSKPGTVIEATVDVSDLIHSGGIQLKRGSMPCR